MSEVPGHVDLAVGGDYTLELDGLATAGYMWQEQVSGPSGVVEVSWSRGFAPGTEPAAVGVSAPEIATVRALAPGEVTLLLEQLRVWEKSVPPLNQHTITIRVT